MKSFASFLAAILMLALVTQALAQESAVLVIDTNDRFSSVLLDDHYLGMSDDSPFLIPPGRHQVVLHSADNALWHASPLSETFVAAAGDTIRLSMAFPYFHRIETIPFGASVYQLETDERRSLGTSPVMVELEAQESVRVSIEKDGYASELLHLAAGGPQLFENHVVALRAERAEEGISSEVSLQPVIAERNWIDYVSAGVAVAGGVAAIHYKFKADRLYRSYERTGDPALRSQIREYDIFSGAGLGVMQIGVGVLAFRLVLR